MEMILFTAETPRRREYFSQRLCVSAVKKCGILSHFRYKP
jgi:hypothetical protein